MQHLIKKMDVENAFILIIIFMTLILALIILACLVVSVDYISPLWIFYSHLQQLYGVSYKESKELTFKQLYGGVFKQYKHLEFFSKIDIYVKELWNTFESDGEITCPVSNFVYKKDALENMNPQKLFNYLLQNLETSMNVRILWDMCGILESYNFHFLYYTHMIHSYLTGMIMKKKL